jgi:hypothetical protein
MFCSSQFGDGSGVIVESADGVHKRCGQLGHNPVPEFIDPVFVKTSPKCSFSVMENKRFGLVFTKTGSINSGTVEFREGPHDAGHLCILESCSLESKICEPFRDQLGGIRVKRPFRV